MLGIIAVPVLVLLVIGVIVTGIWLWLKLKESPKVNKLTERVFTDTADTPEQALDDAKAAKSHVVEKRQETVEAQKQLKKTQKEMDQFLGKKGGKPKKT